jgi:hypothetical protein
LEGEEIRPPKFPSQFKDDPSRNHKNTSNLFDAQLGEETSSVHTDQSRDPLIEPSLRPTVPPSLPDPPNKAILEEVIEEELVDRVRRLSEVIWISSPSTIIPCSIRENIIEAYLNPIMEVNIKPWHLAYTLLSNVPLRPFDKILRSCPSGHILECRGGPKCHATHNR